MRKGLLIKSALVCPNQPVTLDRIFVGVHVANRLLAYAAKSLVILGVVAAGAVLLLSRSDWSKCALVLVRGGEAGDGGQLYLVGTDFDILWFQLAAAL